MKKYPEKTIGELCDIQKGETGILSAIAGEYPLVTTGKERKTSATYQFDTQAVCIPLVSSSGHGKKSLNYVHYQEGKFALGTILAAIIPKNNNEISADFLHQYLLFYKDIKIVPLMKGAANVSLAVKDIAKIEIPLPPINEQKDFIVFFNELQKFNDELIREFEKQEKYVSQLKQAILQEAIAGQLTAEWRTQNPMQKGNPDTDAAALLAKSKAEKQQLIADGKLKKEKPLPEISPDEIPFSLPESWVWCRLGNITTLITDGKHGDCQNEANSGYYFLSAKDIQSGKLVYENSRQITFKDFAEVHKRTNLEAGDICLVNTGATIGKTAIVPSHEFTAKTTFQKSVAVIKVLKKLISIQYLEKILISETSKLLEISKGSAINNLLLGDLRNQLIPLPPLAEQKAIAEKVDRLMETIDQLEQQIKHRKELAEDLMQTVLREAFE